MKSPEIISVRDDAAGLDAFIVIDSLFDGQASGGLRMHPDVTVDELTALARTMTHKYGFYGIPKGGAKGGIRFDPESDPEKVRALLVAFGAKIAGLIRDRRYFPGPDMGTNDGLVRVVLAGAACAERPSALWNTTEGGQFTAAGVIESLARLFRSRGKKIRGARIQLEGIGAVGGSAWRMLHDRGAHVVAVSNRYGAIARDEGLDPGPCFDYLAAHGGAAIEGYPGAGPIDRAAFLGLETDAFLPCGASFSLDRAALETLHAPVIVPGANNPLTEDAFGALGDTVLIPDFVANGGGVVGGALRFAGMSPDETVVWVERIVGAAVAALLKESARAQAGAGAETGAGAGAHAEVRDLRALAEATAESRFAAMQTGRTSRFLLWGMRVKRLGLLPDVVGRVGAVRYAASLARRIGNLPE